MTTLCAGCGHDSITAAIIQAFWELDIAAAPRGQAVRHRLLVEDAGVLPEARRTASTPCTAACRRSPPAPAPPTATLTFIGVSGDGDSLSIGLGPAVPRHPPQRQHALRAREQRRLRPDQGPVLGVGRHRARRARRARPTRWRPIDRVLLALTLGATFVARSFSGDKAQLVPILKAGLAHRGFAFIDVISPCVTFNDHEGSTKSYAYTREHQVEVVQADFVPLRDEITSEQEPGSAKSVMMHDGSWVTFRKVAEHYDPSDRDTRLQLHPRAAEGGRGPDRPALHLARLEGHGRAERAGAGAADHPALRAAVPGIGGARQAAGALPVAAEDRRARRGYLNGSKRGRRTPSTSVKPYSAARSADVVDPAGLGDHLAIAGQRRHGATDVLDALRQVVAESSSSASRWSSIRSTRSVRMKPGISVDDGDAALLQTSSPEAEHQPVDAVVRRRSGRASGHVSPVVRGLGHHRTRSR